MQDVLSLLPVSVIILAVPFPCLRARSSRSNSSSFHLQKCSDLDSKLHLLLMVHFSNSSGLVWFYKSFRLYKGFLNLIGIGPLCVPRLWKESFPVCLYNAGCIFPNISQNMCNVSYNRVFVFLRLYLLKTCHSCVICQDPLTAIQFGWILMIQSGSVSYWQK